MTNLELVLNMLANNHSKLVRNNPKTFADNKKMLEKRR
jgi:hypothetical protein